MQLKNALGTGDSLAIRVALAEPLSRLLAPTLQISERSHLKMHFFNRLKLLHSVLVIVNADTSFVHSNAIALRLACARQSYQSYHGSRFPTKPNATPKPPSHTPLPLHITTMRLVTPSIPLLVALLTSHSGISRPSSGHALVRTLSSPSTVTWRQSPPRLPRARISPRKLYNPTP